MTVEQRILNQEFKLIKTYLIEPGERTMFEFVRIIDDRIDHPHKEFDAEDVEVEVFCAEDDTHGEVMFNGDENSRTELRGGTAPFITILREEGLGTVQWKHEPSMP